MNRTYLSEFISILLLIQFYCSNTLIISFHQFRISQHKPIVHSVFLTSPETNDQYDLEVDTVRVRIWRTLSMKKEINLRQLGYAVGEKNIGDLKSHLLHVEKQAKTIGNKSDEWKIRRGISSEVRKAKLMRRKGEKGLTYIKMDF